MPFLCEIFLDKAHSKMLGIYVFQNFIELKTKVWFLEKKNSSALSYLGFIQLKKISHYEFSRFRFIQNELKLKKML